MLQMFTSHLNLHLQHTNNVVLMKFNGEDMCGNFSQIVMRTKKKNAHTFAQDRIVYLNLFKI